MSNAMSYIMTLKTPNTVQRKTAQLAYFGVGSAHLPWDRKVQTLEPVVETVLENGVREQLSSNCHWGQRKYSSLIYVTYLFHDSNKKARKKILV